MRVLAIETSTRRGSVALTDGDRHVLSLSHERPNSHAEAVLPLIERALAEAGFSRSSLDRVAVGTGPGSFTGLRVGIALGEGLALALALPLVGVGSLQAMTRAVDDGGAAARVAVLDARRGELFVAIYAASGAELFAPAALPREEAREKILRAVASSALVVVGEDGGALGADLEWRRGPELDLPHAHWIAVLGAAADLEQASAQPIYVRGAGATLPKLPPSPLGE